MAQPSLQEMLVQSQAESLWTARWSIVWDMNGDGITTITDFWLWLKWLFFLPGDWSILMLMSYAPQVAVFLELSGSSLYGLASGVTSGSFWFVCIVVAAVAHEQTP